MADLVPIDARYVPHNKRAKLKRNAGLFVDSGGGRQRTASVVLQARCGPHGMSGNPCCRDSETGEKKPAGTPCSWDAAGRIIGRCAESGLCQAI
jgi:hypothetical protein